MGNMSYCRHENTLRDLGDVWDRWDDFVGEDDYELKARRRLVKLICEMAEAFEDSGEAAEETANERQAREDEHIDDELDRAEREAAAWRLVVSEWFSDDEPISGGDLVEFIGALIARLENGETI